MKKHLLLILALLAFVLPARAATELLFNFTQNSNGSDQGTSFSNNANVTAVISNVSYGDTYNVTDYVSSLTNVSNAYYNSKGGLHLGPNGTVTVNLKNTYKVVKYEVMGPTPTQHSIVNTSATVTVNGHTYTGVNAAASGNWNRVQYEPTATENVSSFTIKAGATDVYIKSIHIYLEAETNFTAPKFVPNGGRVKKGQTITVVNCEPSRLPQMDVTYGSNNVANHTGDFTFTFEETGTFDCWATAHSSTWSDYSETTEVSFEVYEDATPEKCATPVFSPASGTFGAGKEITVTCSTPGATISVSDGNDFDINLTSGQTFKLPTAEGEYSYIAEATATGYEASETAYASYTVQWPTCEKPVFNPNGGTVAPGTVVTLTCATAGAEITYYPADNEDDFNLVESGHTFTLPTTPGTYTYKAFADASATFYGQSEIVTATYTVTAPVHNEVAPKISFSHEDQNVFGSEDEIDVTLSLNHDVYPVPEVIYYTLDGFMAHNTLETGNPGATPAGHVLEAAVDPTSLSTVVRIERSHRDALQHQAVTINAYAFNTAGNDVAAATYIFNDNASTPVPVPETVATPVFTPASGTSAEGSLEVTVSCATEGATITVTGAGEARTGSSPLTFTLTPGEYTLSATAAKEGMTTSEAATATYTVTEAAQPQTITATVTMANQGWSNSSSPYTNATTVVNWTSTLANNQNGPTFATTATASGTSYPTYYDADGLRVYASNSNVINVSAPTGYCFTDLTPTFTQKSSGTFQVKDATAESYTTVAKETKQTLSTKPAKIMIKAGAGQVKITKIIFGLEKIDAAKAAVAPKTATANFTYNLVTSADELKAGDIIVIAAKYKDQYYAMSSATSSYFNATTVTVSEDKIEANDALNEITLENNSEGNIIFNCSKYVDNSYLSSAKSTSISFVTKDQASAVNFTFNDDKTVKIYFANTDSRALFFNYNTSSKLYSFRNYSYSSNWNNSNYGKSYIFKKVTAGPVIETVATPEIALSAQAQSSDPVTVTISCATAGAVIEYSLDNGSTWTKYTSLTVSEPGTYTVKARATKEGMNPSEVATSAQFTITEPVKPAEVVEELFFVMDQNLWDVDGAYPETVVPFVYDRENGWYDLDIASIPATGWRQTAEGWFEINGGFRGNFYVRDGKANRKGLVFGAAGTVANTTYATRAAADGNQLVEPGVEYNMYIAGEGDTHKVFTTIGDDTNSKAFSAGTIRVTHTPGNKDAAKPMTLQILANSDQTTGVDSITAEDAANDADARFFNLQGVEVPADRLAPGIYIRQAGSKATKVLVK